MRSMSIWITILLVFLAGCSPALPEATPASVSAPTPVEAPEDAMEPVILGVADIDEFRLQANPDYPDLFEITLRGHYPDDCTSREEVTIDENEDGVLVVTLHTRRPTDAACSNTPTAFEEYTGLEMGGYAFGRYRVRMGEVETTIEYTEEPPPPQCDGTAQVGQVHWWMPDPICPEARYMIYLHGKIIEDEGFRPTHPDHGVYEYSSILEALSAPGFQVISEWREQNTATEPYAQRVARQVRQLLEAGVPPEHITVMGFSKGGAIALMASSLLQGEEINYVILAACHDWAFEDPGLILNGRVLSIYEASDSAGLSCQPLFERSDAVITYQEMRIETGRGHGAFYTPDPVWVEPAIEWAGTDQ